MPSLATLATLASSYPLAIRQTTTDAASAATTSTIGYDDGNVYYDNGFFYSEKAQVIKWAVFLGLLTFLAIFFGVAYWHAQRRMKKGLPPLAYHRFLVRRQYNAQWGPRPQFTPQYVPQEGYYGMNAYPPPPPMYNANYPQPPQYEPSKADGAAPPPPQAHVNPNPNPFADENGSSSQQENGVTEPGQAHTESRRWRFGRK